jgi:hypothetical protein
MNAKAPLGIFLLFAVLLPAITPGTAFPSEKAAPRGNKVLLSLKIARSRNARTEIRYYKSIARQQKVKRSLTPRHPSSAR